MKENQDTTNAADKSMKGTTMLSGGGGSMQGG